MKFKANVFVTLKRTVNDPQGRTIMMGLHQLGYDGITDVRAGKFLELWLDAPDQAAAEQQVAAMCDRLLANTVIENYAYAVVEARGDQPDALNR